MDMDADVVEAFRAIPSASMSGRTGRLDTGARQTRNRPLLICDGLLWHLELMVILTADLDWAPEWLTRELLRRWRNGHGTGTLFVTHACPALDALSESDGIELAWHPNFQPGSTHGSSPDEVLDTLRCAVPGAVGIRTHGLVTSTELLEKYGERGLLYESSYLMHGTPDLAPNVAWNGVIKFPIFWEDDVHIRYGRAFRLADLDLDRPGLKVFDFHPVHVALNSSGPSAYLRLKKRLVADGRSMLQATPEDLAAAADDGPCGTSDLLDELLEWSARHPDRVIGTMALAARRVRDGWQQGARV